MSETILEPVLPLLDEVRPRHWRRWLITYFCYSSTIRLLFTSAIWVIYLAAHGYSPLMIGLMEMTFHVAKFFAEVPTGIFADLLGRRKSLILYCLIAAIETCTFLMPTTPILFIGFALSGISYAFLGGSHDAVLWTLTGHGAPGGEQGHAVRYSRFFSLGLMLGIVCEIIGTTLGGYFGGVMQTLPFICRAFTCLLAIIPLLLLPDAATEPERVVRSERPHPLTHLFAGLMIVWRSPRLLGLILISGLSESCSTTIYYFVQLQLHTLGFTLAIVGLIMAASSVSQFAFTALAPYLIQRVPVRLLVAACVLAQLIGLLLMSTPGVIGSVIGFLLFLQAASAILYPTISTRINESCPEAQRATILSFETGLFSLTMIVLFPLFGLGLTSLPYSIVYGLTALVLVIGSLTSYLLVRARRLFRGIA